MLSKVSTLRIFVHDLNSSIEFYRDKLGMNLEFETEGFAQFSTDSLKIALEYVDPKDIEESKEHVGRFIGLSFQVDDIQSVYEKLSSSGVKFSGAPEEMEWGGKLTHFYDLSNNCLSLVQST